MTSFEKGKETIVQKHLYNPPGQLARTNSRHFPQNSNKRPKAEQVYLDIPNITAYSGLKKHSYAQQQEKMY